MEQMTKDVPAWLLAKLVDGFLLRNAGNREDAEDDGKETQGESLDCNATHIHTLGDKLSKLYSRFSHSCTIYLDH